MIVTGDSLKALILSGKVLAPMSALQPSHIDVTLGAGVLCERTPNGRTDHWDWEREDPVDLAGGEKVAFTDCGMPHILAPNAFALFKLKEKITLPLDMTAEFYLDSGPARSCVEHSCATLLIPGWSGYLTLEIKNVAQYHSLMFSEGMNIGKIVFHQHGLTAGYTGKFQHQTELSA